MDENMFVPYRSLLFSAVTLGTFCPSSSHRSPRLNMSRSGNTSVISHTKPSVDRVYRRQRVFLPSPNPTPQSRSANWGGVCILRNVCPIANFSSRKSRSHKGAVIVTSLVAMQAVFPSQTRWTSRRCVMGSSGEATWVRGEV
jgi:hypothetical protein